MEFMNEYGLLIAVALPAAAIVAINVALALGGERGTLLLPSLKPYPTVFIPVQEAAAAPTVAEVARTPRPVCEGFDEIDERLARHAA